MVTTAPFKSAFQWLRQPTGKSFSTETKDLSQVFLPARLHQRYVL